MYQSQGKSDKSKMQKKEEGEKPKKNTSNFGTLCSRENRK